MKSAEGKSVSFSMRLEHLSSSVSLIYNLVFNRDRMQIFIKVTITSKQNSDVFSFFGIVHIKVDMSLRNSPRKPFSSNIYEILISGAYLIDIFSLISFFLIVCILG